jgi:hypothetical protein
VPERDRYSSFIVRQRRLGEETIVPFRFYDDNPFKGDVLALMPGRYPDLNNLGIVAGQTAWNDDIDCFEGSSDYRVWGFDGVNYRDGIAGPYTPPVSNLDGWNNKFASMIIQPADEPTIAIFLDAPGPGVVPLVYPIIDVSRMSNTNKNDAVDVPPGYVVYGYANDDFGGRGDFCRNEGTEVLRCLPTSVEGDSMHDDWDSFIVRPIDDPTVTLYFAGSYGNPQIYPLGSFPDLEDHRTNNIKGADIPCGVTVEAWSCDNYDDCDDPGHWVVVGPLDTAAVGAEFGQDNWDSMKIYRNGDACE